MRRRNGAFTLIELVIVIAVIGILAAIAIPRFIDIRAEAYLAQRDGIVGGVRSGIMLVASENQVATTPQSTTFPPNLEVTWGSISGAVALGSLPAVCATANPCFELVFSQPLLDANWQQASTTTYTFTDPTGGATKTYTYTQATGRFE